MVRQLITKNISVIVSVLLAGLVLCYYYYNNKTLEAFQDPTTTQTPTPEPTPELTPEPTPEPTPELTPEPTPELTLNPDCPSPGEWYENSPIKSIFSRYFGVGINVSPAISALSGNINSKYLIFIESTNKDTPQGALSLDSMGTYSVQIPNGNNHEQQWDIKTINSESDLQELKSDVSSAADEKYPFYVVGKMNSTTDVYYTLQYDNGSIAARPFNNYETQKWTISKNPINQPAIHILDSNQLTRLTPEYRPSDTATAVAAVTNQGGYDPSTQSLMLQQMTNANQADVMKSFQQILSLLQKEGKIEPPTETTFGNKPLTINLKVGGNPDKVVEAVQSNEGFQATNSVTDLLDKWENKQLEPLRQAELNAFKKTNNGQSCPTPNMDDYVRKTGIPCVACSNF